MSRNDTLDEHIVNIVQTQHIAEQIDLQHHLKARGFETPQATLSRRLKRLHIAKIGGQYQVVDLAPTNLPAILTMEVSDFGLIVLHTHPGNANSLAIYLDKKFVFGKSGGILGTIAGDDTVLLIIKSKAHLKDVIETFQNEFPYLATP
ncbi:MAG: ArgR family transcriptional regulator [Tatlockia sp.]|jgi:transcriptional regulator of arginine metabolism